MVDFIYSIMLLSFGIACAFLVLLYGLRFCRLNGKEEPKTSLRGRLWQILKGFPFWVWFVAFLVFQPSVPLVLSTWYPVWWSNHEWIQNLSSFSGLLVTVIYVILVKITDEDGKLKYFIKNVQKDNKGEGKLLLCQRGVFTYKNLKVLDA